MYQHIKTAPSEKVLLNIIDDDENKECHPFDPILLSIDKYFILLS